jgi:hypothetical protein
MSRPVVVVGSAVVLATACSTNSASGPPFTVMTFNTGTTSGLPHDDPPDDGYGSQQAAYSNDYYGDGLAWLQVIDDTHAFTTAVSPGLVAFQEIFDPAGCATVPAEARTGFVCESWQPGDPTVAQMVVGAGYQVACNPDHPDICLAVKRSFGTFRGCSDDACPDAMAGYEVAGCGHGARAARAVIELADGTELTVVNLHGTSGFAVADEDCRVQQVDQIFVDLGDGAPGTSGDRNIIFGDLNTDPGRLADADPSAARWLDFAALPGMGGRPFHFVSPVGPDVAPTYAGTANIDHVVSDVATGECWSAGVSDGHPAVTDTVYYDHHPVVCQVALPE